LKQSSVRRLLEQLIRIACFKRRAEDGYAEISRMQIGYLEPV
jgi:hypothetical protein